MKKWRMLLLALLLALLCGCAASEPLPDYAPEESQRLILYTSHKKEVWQPIVKEFEARTGVWVTVVEGGSNELLEQLAAKTDAPQADVMFGGGVESLESYQDLFAPYTCADADAILPQYRAKDDIWTPFSSLPLVFVYNPKLVGAEEITGWADLLRPELYGTYHHISVLGDDRVEGRRRYAVGDRIPEPREPFGQRLLPECRRGARLVLHDVGAYGAAMGYSYGLTPHCAEYLYQADGTLRCIRRAQREDELFSTLDENPDFTAPAETPSGQAESQRPSEG